MTIFSHWPEHWNQPGFRTRLIVTLSLLIIALFCLTRFLDGVETRTGATLADPLLALFQPRDTTWITFILIYAGLMMGIFLLVRDPDLLLLALQSYTLMVAFRITAMTLLPLDPPPGIIVLQDPFVQFFGSGKILTKDLFFSGHTSTLFLLFLTAQRWRFKAFFLVCAIGVGACVLLQYVHYSVDVYAAPFFAYVSYRMVVLLNATKRGNVTACR